MGIPYQKKKVNKPQQSTTIVKSKPKPRKIVTMDQIMEDMWKLGMESKYPRFHKIGLIIDGALVDHNNSYTYQKFEYFMQMIQKKYTLVRKS